MNAIILDNVEHHDLKVIAGQSEAFGASVNEVAVFSSELAEVHREYPIYFRREENSGFQAFALLGLDEGENLFLGRDGWKGHYIPAMLERGPFLIGRSAPGPELENLKVLIDIDHPRVSRTEGKPLFLKHGGYSPTLDRYLDRLKTIHAGMTNDSAMFAAFAAAGLIAPMALEIKFGEDRGYVFWDCFTISASGLANLDGPTLFNLHQAGHLTAAIYIVNSLGNITRITEMKRSKALASPGDH